MYIKDSEYEIKINNKRIVFTDRIKTILEFNNLVIILLLDKQYKPNNIVAYNNNGNKVWEINDILRIKKPSGFDEIEKKTDTILSAYCITGILYDIDIENKKIISSVFLGQTILQYLSYTTILEKLDALSSIGESRQIHKCFDKQQTGVKLHE